MNHAELALHFIEKTASPKGLVMAALEAATGAAVGGTMGVMSAREGRRNDPIGPSDISGAVYGGLMRSAAVHKGIRADQRLKSYADRISNMEDMLHHKRVKASNYGAIQNMDQLYKDSFGVTYTDAKIQMFKRQAELQKNILDAQVRLDQTPATKAGKLAKRNYQLDLAKQELDDFKKGPMQQFKENTKVFKEMQRFTQKSEMAEAAALEFDKKQYESLHDSYRKMLEDRQRQDARRMFFGIKF